MLDCIIFPIDSLLDSLEFFLDRFFQTSDLKAGTKNVAFKFF